MTNFEKFIEMLNNYNYEIFTTGDYIISLYIRDKNKHYNELYLREIDNIKDILPINVIKEEINEMMSEHFEKFIKNIEPHIKKQILNG